MPDTKSDISKRKEPTEPEESNSEQSPKKSKTQVLPLLETFLDTAKPLKVIISNDTEDNEDIITSLVAKPIKMSTGSYGWSTTGKAKVQCDGEEVPVQISINIVVPGSKNSSQESENAEE